MLNLDPWWDEPDYKEAQKGTFSDRGAFILRKLRARDAEKVGTVLRDVYCDAIPDPIDITKFEWQVILSYLGASEEEIEDVQWRMGRVWK